MSANERLGIQLYFDTQNLDGQLKYIRDRLQATFGDLSKLVKAAGIGDALKQEFQGSKNFFAEYSKQLGRSFSGSKEEIASLRKEIRDLNNEIKARSKATKLLQLDGDITELEKFKKKVQEAKDKLKDLQEQAQRRLAIQQIDASNINKQFDINKAAANFNPQTMAWAKDIQTQSAQAERWLQSLGRQGFKYVNGEIVEANKSMKGFNGGLLNLLNLEARFYGVRTALFAVSSQIRDSITSVLDLNQALHDTAAISGASVAEMQRLESVALNLAASSKFTAKGIMDIMKTLAQAGVNANQMPDVTRATVMFATGAGATPDQAVKLLTTSLNAFDIEAKDSMKVANALTAALNSSKLEAGGLGTAFNYIANQASIMGMSLEESLGIVSAISQKGVMSSTIGTGMSQLIANLAAPKAPFRKLLDDKGIDFDKINPAKNNFVDVVKELEKAQFTLKELEDALESRVARAMFTTLNVGSDGFARMTEAITGTNATLIANMKAMEGARNQMNVLKQEFVIAVNDISKHVGGPLVAAFKLLRTFVAGLSTDGGQFILMLTSIGVAAMALTPMIISATKAIQTLGLATAIFTKLNPWVLALTVALGGAAAAISLFGAAQRKSKKELEDYTKQIGTTADKIKQAEDGMNSFILSVKSTGLSKAKYSDLTIEQKKSLDELVKNFPEYLSGLNREKDLIDQIGLSLDKVIENKRIGARIGVSTYNYYDDLVKKEEQKIQTLETEIAGAPKETRSRRRYLNKLGEKYNEEPSVALDKFKEQRERYKQWRTLGSDHAGTFGLVDPMTGKMAFTEPTPSKPKGKIEPGSRSDDSATKRKEELEKELNDYRQNLKKFQDDTEQLKEKSNMDALKVSMDLNEKTLKDESKDFDTKLRASYDLKKQWIQLYETEYQKEVAKTKDEFVSKLGAKGLYDETANKALTDRLSALKKERDDKTRDKLSSINLGDSLPADKLQLTSDNLEKQADRALRIKQQDLALQQQQAKTSEQVRDITIYLTRAQIENSEAKKSAYETDIENLNNWLYTAKETDTNYQANLDKLVSIQDKHQAIVQLIKEQNYQLEIQQDKSFSGNFKRGMERYQKGLGTTPDAMEGLGYDLTNTLGSGVENTMNTMIDALERGGNAWRSFREGIGNVLQDIAQEIQKFLVKEAVKSFMKWAIMFFGNMLAGAGSSGGAEMTPSPYETTVTWQPSSGGAGLNKGGFVGFSGKVLRYDSGGQVPLNMGTPNVDSIPAILTPGEVVIKKPAVDYYGVDYFLKHNAMKFADGGLVPGGSKRNTNDSSTLGNLTIINVADSSSIPPQQPDEQQIVNIVSFNLSKNSQLKKTIRLIAQGN